MNTLNNDSQSKIYIKLKSFNDTLKFSKHYPNGKAGFQWYSARFDMFRKNHNAGLGKVYYFGGVGDLRYESAVRIGPNQYDKSQHRFYYVDWIFRKCSAHEQNELEQLVTQETGDQNHTENYAVIEYIDTETNDILKYVCPPNTGFRYESVESPVLQTLDGDKLNVDKIRVTK
jgi:hypothetical protein